MAYGRFPASCYPFKCLFLIHNWRYACTTLLIRLLSFHLWFLAPRIWGSKEASLACSALLVHWAICAKRRPFGIDSKWRMQMLMCWVGPAFFSPYLFLYISSTPLSLKSAACLNSWLVITRWWGLEQSVFILTSSSCGLLSARWRKLGIWVIIIIRWVFHLAEILCN